MGTICQFRSRELFNHFTIHFCLFIDLFYLFIIRFDSQGEISTTFIIDFLLGRTSPKETESICQ